ncbi:DUF445 domain-containing protein [Heyndrickxia sporothermodurans]|uniref:DUF445 domain-containing protein n=1 Tax=Heyndrickxia sporothermodurans TaxID=46224 RepID=UPI002DBBD34B|nr:DUF445 domain-containing protein [Heyndrickxia sporothermodurans]MEB6549605.1 DUF445 domain-containing protein [Heyndrickxia sporothermodurans]
MVRSSKHLARISLAIMGVGFVLTFPFSDSKIIAFLHGGFEAGIVGGLADWFAVTALFRYPFGIPIPHTSLLTKNRSRITKALISTLENDWLSKKSIKDKLNTIQMTEKIINIAERELQSPRLNKAIATLLSQMIVKVDVQKLAPLLSKYMKDYLYLYKMQSLLEVGSKKILDHQFDQKGLDYLLMHGEKWISKEETKYKLGSMAVTALNKIELDGFLQFALKSFQSLINEEKMGKIIQNLISNVIHDLQNPNSNDREKVLLSIQTFLHNAGDNQALIEELEKFKQSLLEEWDPSESIEKILFEMQKKLAGYIQNSPFVEAHLIPLIMELFQSLRGNQEKMMAIETWLHTQITNFVEENHSKIDRLVEENLNKLDDQTLINMVENNIGKDLQWIRVNGAICGFIIGILITGIEMLFSL